MSAFRKLFTLAAAAVVASGLAGPAVAQATSDQPDNRPTIMVWYFTNGAIGKAHEELDPLSKGIADMLITELAANPKVRVVERDELQKLLEEQNLSASERVDKETMVKVGKILGAHYMVTGGFVTDPRGNMRLDSRVVRVETSEIVHPETVQNKSDNLMQMISDLAGKMNKNMNLPDLPRAVRESRNEAAKKVPFQAVLLYSKGLAEADRGNREKAVELYKQAIAKFPDYAAPKKELDKLSKTTE